MGSRTMAQALGVSRWRARRLMQLCQLVSKQPGKPKYRPARQEALVVPNQLNRAFSPTAPNRVWCGDITYVRMAGQWTYLAVVLDLYARRIVGWSLSTTPDTALVAQALRRAVETRRPKPGLLFHSDQGVQYRSEAYRQQLAQHQIRQSMKSQRELLGQRSHGTNLSESEDGMDSRRRLSHTARRVTRYRYVSDGVLQPRTITQL